MFIFRFDQCFIIIMIKVNNILQMNVYQIELIRYQYHISKLSYPTATMFRIIFLLLLFFFCVILQCLCREILRDEKKEEYRCMMIVIERLVFKSDSPKVD